MPRKTEEELKKESPKEDIEEETQTPGIMEVSIDLNLLNNKLNYLISKVDEISNVLISSIPKK